MFFVAVSALLAAVVGLAADARAAWPPAPGATPDQLKDSANWPKDPDYGPRAPDGTPSLGGTGGQWELWSWIPPHDSSHVPRPKETATGISVDVAWSYTIGNPSVKIAVLDSGIKWDESGLVNKAALNAVELTKNKPLDATGKACGGDAPLEGFDCNKDGVFDLNDYRSADPKVGVQTSSGAKFHDANGNGILDPGDLIVLFSDGVDDDNNGFVDDISGWDFFKDDNDPYDDTRYGHGSGEARDSTEEGNEGQGGIGVCPKCRFIPLRVGDSFIADADDFAQAATYAVDNGASVIQEALGTVDQTQISRAAIDYAYAKGVTVIASAADENSRHHNMPGSANHTIVVHALKMDRDEAKDAHTYLNFHPCSNYGGNGILSVPGTCASGATGMSAGVTGLMYSMALQKGIKDLNGEEVRQLMTGAADLIDVPESYDPSAPGYDAARYFPSKPTFSQRFGYGRLNAGKIMGAINAGRMPPQIDLVTPQWFEVIYPAQLTKDVELKGTITTRSNVKTFDGVIEWAPGVDPDEDKWKQLSSIPAQPGGTVLGGDGTPLGYLKVKDLPKIDNEGEPENRYTITVRIRVVSHYGDPIGDVKGETRKTFYILDDPSLVPGFPKYLGSSGEASPRLVDLDGDGKREIVYPTSEGLLHAMHTDGSELAGFPVKTRRLDGFAEGDKEDSPFVAHYLGAGAKNAWTSGAMPLDKAREAIMSAPAIADVDGDGKPEIFFGTWSGTVYGVHADGTPVSSKWPKRLPDVPSCPRGEQPKLPDGTVCMDEHNLVARGAFAAITLVDMNKDGKLDVISPAFDGNVYVWDAQGNDLPGFPVLVKYNGNKGPIDETVKRARIVTTAAVGDMTGDGLPEIGVGSTQYLGKGKSFGAFYAIDGRGNAAGASPYLDGWPQVVTSIYIFPLVGEGIVSAGMMADVNGDGVPEMIFHGTGGTPVVLPAHPEIASLLGATSPSAVLTLDPTFGRLYESPKGLAGNNMIGLFSQPSVGDLDQDGHPDIVALGGSFYLALALASSEKQDYEQHAAFWSTAPGDCIDPSTGQPTPGKKCGSMFPGSPTIIEDYTFFHNATVADVSGDDYPETIVGTGGYYVRAIDACGREAKGFPKFTGQWIIPSTAVGDIDGDKSLEIVTGTRDGWLYAWHTDGHEDGVVEWPTHHHDNQNTGNYATKTDFPSARKAKAPLDLASCKKDVAVEPPPPVGNGSVSGGGCGCSVPKGGSAALGATASLLGVALALVRRRRHR